jgi:hypothetical protein
MCVVNLTVQLVAIGPRTHNIKLVSSTEISMRMPTAMIFVPNKNGISHPRTSIPKKEDGTYHSIISLATRGDGVQVHTSECYLKL